MGFIKTKEQLDVEFRQMEFMKAVKFASEKWRVVLLPYQKTVGIDTSRAQIRCVDVQKLEEAMNAPEPIDSNGISTEEPPGIELDLSMEGGLTTEAREEELRNR